MRFREYKHDSLGSLPLTVENMELFVCWRWTHETKAFASGPRKVALSAPSLIPGGVFVGRTRGGGCDWYLMRSQEFC